MVSIFFILKLEYKLFSNFYRSTCCISILKDFKFSWKLKKKYVFSRTLKISQFFAVFFISKTIFESEFHNFSKFEVQYVRSKEVHTNSNF